jgi:hypothetical protein
MNSFLKEFFAWSEVWALFIPLTILFIRRKHITKDLKPLVIYVWVAVVLNTLADFIWKFGVTFDLPTWLQNNNPLYNLHSSFKVLFFGWLFLINSSGALTRFIKFIISFYIIFVVLNFTFNQSFWFLSSRLLVIEVILLLIFGILWCLDTLKKDSTDAKKQAPVFYVVIGIFIYSAVLFIIFLFYPLIAQVSRNEFDQEFALRVWDIHNITFMILCFFIAKAFYECGKI